jgi:phosphomannomutase
VKQLVVFDLDGILAESKSSVEPEMVALLNSLLEVTKVAVG